MRDNLPYGTLMLVMGRTDEHAAESPIHICMNCGRSILPSEGGARWVEGPGLWLSDEEGAEHVDRELCERHRVGNHMGNSPEKATGQDACDVCPVVGITSGYQ